MQPGTPRSILKSLGLYVLVLLGIVACAAPPTLADHCPDDEVTAGPPEYRLAGLSFRHDGIEQALRRFGPPAQRREDHDEELRSGSGWAEYEWTFGDTTLTVSTAYYTSDSGLRVETMTDIVLRGAPSTRVSGTGRGLRLGDGFGRSTELYGGTFVEGTVNGPALAARTVTYCFTDETELGLGFDEAGRLVAIRLAPSAE